MKPSSIPLINSNENAYDSFITDKIQIYTNETIISIPLTNSNENAYDSFITNKIQIYTDEK